MRAGLRACWIRNDVVQLLLLKRRRGYQEYWTSGRSIDLKTVRWLFKIDKGEVTKMSSCIDTASGREVLPPASRRVEGQRGLKCYEATDTAAGVGLTSLGNRPCLTYARHPSVRVSIHYTARTSTGTLAFICLPLAKYLINTCEYLPYLLRDLDACDRPE